MSLTVSRGKSRQLRTLGMPLYNGLNIDLHKLRADSFEELVDALSEIEIDVQDEDERVRVYCE